MGRHFARFADAVAEVWASAPWFGFCAGFVLAWAFSGLVFGASNETWHLWLNSPTTALTFLGMFLLHHVQHRFEKRVERDLGEIHEAVCSTGVDKKADEGADSYGTTVVRDEAEHRRGLRSG